MHHANVLKMPILKYLRTFQPFLKNIKPLFWAVANKKIGETYRHLETRFTPN